MDDDIRDVFRLEGLPDPPPRAGTPEEPEVCPRCTFEATPELIFLTDEAVLLVSPAGVTLLPIRRDPGRPETG